MWPGQEMEPPKTRMLSSFIIAGICGGDHKFYEAVKIPMGDTKTAGYFRSQLLNLFLGFIADLHFSWMVS